MDSLGFVFPGYGSQCVGMGKDFYDHYRIVQERFEEASNCMGLNFVKLCFASSEKELSKPLYAYLSLFVVHAALCEVLYEHEIFPHVITGWGIGYASALYAARVINFPDGLYVLKKYVTFFEESTHGSSTVCACVIGVSLERLYEFLGRPELCGNVSVALIRSEYEHIILGETSCVEVLTNMIKREESFAKIVPEPLAYGLHSFLRRNVFQRLSAYLAKIDCKPLRFDLITQEGIKVSAGQQLEKSSLIRFVHTPIDVPRVVRGLCDYDRLVQIGSQRSTLAIIKALVINKTIVPFARRSDLKELVK